MRRMIFTAFTGKDNASIDLGLCLWCLSTFSFLGFMAFSLIWRLEHFDPMTWAGALGALNIMHATSQKVKETTEPGG